MGGRPEREEEGQGQVRRQNRAPGVFPGAREEVVLCAHRVLFQENEIYHNRVAKARLCLYSKVAVSVPSRRHCRPA